MMPAVQGMAVMRTEPRGVGELLRCQDERCGTYATEASADAGTFPSSKKTNKMTNPNPNLLCSLWLLWMSGGMVVAAYGILSDCINNAMEDGFFSVPYCAFDSTVIDNPLALWSP